MVQTISVQELKTKREQGVVPLIDVRAPSEFRSFHIQGAELHPLDTFDPARIIAQHSGSPVYVICHGGNRSAKAAQLLEDAGCQKVVSIAGGTKAWEDAGFALERGRAVISLERQVRIAAGFLVLLGVLFGFSLAPLFFGLSAFVGAGLMFAGITDTCGMAMVLSRMPWNR